MSFQQFYSIAGERICLDAPQPLRQTEPFLPFRAQPGPVSRTVRYCTVDSLTLPDGPVFYQTMFFTVHKTGDSLIRVYRDPKEGGRPYAVRRVTEHGSLVEVYYHPEDQKFFCETGNAFYHAALEEWMLRCGGVILHASLVQVNGCGILFSGPAGVGKSTQAALWQKEMGAELINGDRVILRQPESRWIGYGSPYAGSSLCWRNASVPASAIVLLEQGQENQLSTVGPLDAFRGIWSGLTLNSWNPVFVDWASRMTRSLIASVPVYHLTCRPDSGSVQVLARALEERGLPIGSG